MSQKINSKNEHKNLNTEMPIFEAKCINNSSRCKLIYVGCAEKDKVVGDYPIEFNTPKEMVDLIGKNAYSVCEYKQYNVIAKIMCCSINGGYLSQFDTIPCYYMTLLYNSKFGVAGTVLTVGINFVIENDQLNKISIPYQEEKKRLKLEKKNKKNKLLTNKITEENETVEKCEKNIVDSTIDDDENKETSTYNQNNSTGEIKKRTIEIDLKKLINSELYGTYYISLTCDKDEQNIFLNKMKIKCNVSSNPDDTSEENIKNNEIYLEYVKMFQPIKLESYPNKNVIIYNKFIKHLKNEKFMEFVYSIIDQRFNEKVKEVGHFFDHKLPKNIFSYKKLKENPELIDQMLDEDDRSSNKSSDEEN